jgi:hypothetical protein
VLTLKRKIEQEKYYSEADNVILGNFEFRGNIKLHVSLFGVAFLTIYPVFVDLNKTNTK